MTNDEKKLKTEYLNKVITREYLESAYLRLDRLEDIANECGVGMTAILNRAKKLEFKFDKGRRNPCNDLLFSTDTERSFYVAGFICGDGNLSSGDKIRITLASKDRGFLSLIKDAMGIENPIFDNVSKDHLTNSRYKNPSYGSSIYCTSRQMFDDLARFGAVPKKSLTLEFPQWMKAHPLRHHFIRGYYDSDGCWSFRYNKDKFGVDTGKHQVRCSVRGTKNFLTDLRDVLEADTGIAKKIGDVKLSAGIYKLEYAGNQITKKISDYLYKDATLYLERKYLIATSHGKAAPMTPTESKLQYLIDNDLPLPV